MQNILCNFAISANLQSILWWFEGILEGGGEAVEDGFEGGAGGAYVEAHQAGAFFAEHGSVVEGQTRFVYEEVD